MFRVSNQLDIWWEATGGVYLGFLDPIGGHSNIPSLNLDRKREFRDVGWIKKASDWSDLSWKTWSKMWKISVELWGGLEVVSTYSGINSTTTLQQHASQLRVITTRHNRPTTLKLKYLLNCSPLTWLIHHNQMWCQPPSRKSVMWRSWTQDRFFSVFRHWNCCLSVLATPTASCNEQQSF